VQGLAIRVARSVNRVLGRHGPVWAGRYHARILAMPREMRNALVYVLQNWKKHVPRANGLEPRSSAGAFTGWRDSFPRTLTAAPVVAPHTWLASVGWWRHGLLDAGEAPRRAPRSR
jgi:hypothetical protein